MFEEEDRETGYAVFIAVTVAIVASAFAIAIAIGTALGQAEPTKPAARGAASASVVRIIGVVLFEVGKADPPADVMMLLGPAIRVAKVMPGARIVVSSYHDASGDPAMNEELAKRRAIAVRDVLMAAGIAEQRIELAKPISTLGGADPDLARRVELTIR